jgi:hypothetical protein
VQVDRHPPGVVNPVMDSAIACTAMLLIDRLGGSILPLSVVVDD